MKTCPNPWPSWMRHFFCLLYVSLEYMQSQV